MLPGPGGDLELTYSLYFKLEDQHTVRITGTQLNFFCDPGLPCTVKLEAAKLIGFRTIFMGDIRDPILTSQLSIFQIRVRKFVTFQLN